MSHIEGLIGSLKLISDVRVQELAEKIKTNMFIQIGNEP